jgi:hypothetical protein
VLETRTQPSVDRSGRFKGGAFEKSAMRASQTAGHGDVGNRRERRERLHVAD